MWFIAMNFGLPKNCDNLWEWVDFEFVATAQYDFIDHSYILSWALLYAKKVRLDRRHLVRN